MITADEARAALYSDPNRARCIAQEKKRFEWHLQKALDKNKFQMNVFWNSVWHFASGATPDRQHNIAKEMIEWAESLGYEVKPSHRHDVDYTVHW